MKVVVNTPKLIAVIALLSLLATAVAMIFLWTRYYYILLIALTIQLFIIIYYTAHYYGSTEKHYFILLDESGEVMAIKSKRINKSTAKRENVKLENKVYEISPLRKYHILSNFAETELKLIETKEAIAKAETKSRQTSMLDLTVKSLTQLFRSNELMFLLLIIAVALSALNVVLTLLIGGGS